MRKIGSVDVEILIGLSDQHVTNVAVPVSNLLHVWELVWLIQKVEPSRIVITVLALNQAPPLPRLHF